MAIGNIPSAEICPNGEGLFLRPAEGSGVWIDENKATCYANQLEWLDARPELEQLNMDLYHKEALAYAEARVAHTEMKYKTRYMRKLWGYTLGAIGLVLGIFVGMGASK